MIYCGITIDYLSQLERIGRQAAADLTGQLRVAAAGLGGSPGSKNSPLVIAFPDSKPFDRFLAAIAISRFRSAILEARPSLHGASLGVHVSEFPDDAVLAFDTLRLSAGDHYPVAFSREARMALGSHFRFREADGSDRWSPPEHETCLGDADATALLAGNPALDGLCDAVKEALPGAWRLAKAEGYNPSRSIASIASILGSDVPGTPVISLKAPRIAARAYSPLTETLDERLLASIMDPLDSERRSEMEAFMSAFGFASTGLFSDLPDEARRQGCESFLHLALDALGDRGALLVCDDPSAFPAETIALVADRLGSGRGTERYLVYGQSSLPPSWPAGIVLRIESPLSERIVSSMEVALGSDSGPSHPMLKHRFAALCGHRKAARHNSGYASSALSLLPREAALFLYGLLLTEGVLDADLTGEFFHRIGLPHEGIRVVQDLLARAGLVDPTDRLALRRPLDRETVVAAAGPQGADFIETEFRAYLVSLYERRLVRPSLGLLAKVGERADLESLLYDGIFSDALASGTVSGNAADFLSPSSAAIHRFWSALARGDRDACEAAAAGDGSIGGARASAVRGLIKAELAYAQGDAERSAKGAREALLAVGKGVPVKLEVRAHRMMGLSALAAGRYSEASDYLGNAQELSEAGGDNYERFMAAYARAIGEFMTGALVRSLNILSQAADSAVRVFRVDALGAIEFLRGRIDLELGAYDEAARRYETLELNARSYGVEAAACRASIWRGRALAYAGAFDESAAALAEYPDDPEARVFMGENELLRGRPHESRAWLQSPGAPRARSFKPSDSFHWAGSFSEVEGRCLDFGAADATLDELRDALRLFAAGLDERDPAYATELYSLTRGERSNTANPGAGTYSFMCYMMEERLENPPVDRQTVLSRAFKVLQQRSGKIEDRSRRSLYMEKNYWNSRLLVAAKAHKFI